MTYSLTLTPSPALLGKPVSVSLRAVADIDSPQALTFEHKSLTIELTRANSTQEPLFAFPNRRVILDAGILFRQANAGGIEHLQIGETLSREFALDNLFPLAILDAAEFLVTFSLADETRVFRPNPVSLQVFSSQAAVDALFSVLDEELSARRARAAALLQRMTLHGLVYDAFADVLSRNSAAKDWQAWWTSIGNRLPWNPDADSAIPYLPVSERSSHLGAAHFTYTPWSDYNQRALLQALKQWSDMPRLSSLQGYERVADITITYPPEGTLVQLSAEAQNELAQALNKLGDLVKLGEDRAKEADLLLATLASAPSSLVAKSLAQWADLIPTTPKWAVARARCHALRNLLMPHADETET